MTVELSAPRGWSRPRPRTRSPRSSAGALLVLSVVLVAACDTAYGEPVELRWQLEAGETRLYRQVQTSRTATPMGEMVQTQTVLFREHVAAVGDDGVARVRVTYESMHVVQDGPMGRQEFDSREPAAGDPGLALLGVLTGRSFEMRLAPDGSVLDVSGLDDMMEDVLAAALADAPPEVADQIRRTLEAMFSDESMKSMMQQGKQILPTAELAPGSEWSHEVVVTLPFGTATHANTYTLRRVTQEGGRRVARIQVDGTVGAMQPDPHHPLFATIEFLGGTTTGELYFDVERGVVIRSSVSTTLSVRAMGEEMETRSDHQMELVDEGVGA
jgi:hypothetical protein